MISTVNCSASTSRYVADRFRDGAWRRDFPNVDGVFAITHKGGCGLPFEGPDHQILERVLAGFANHPNVAAYVIVGLGCEVGFAQHLVDSQDLVTLGVPGAQRPRQGRPAGPGCSTSRSRAGSPGPSRRPSQAVHELLPEANAWTRSEQPASKISLAMECGGSDGNSGVTANPALGVAADLIVAQGGTAFLGETTEIYGAEHLLTRRAVSREVGEKLVERIKWWEWYTGVFGAKIDNNPSPGNKAGGLTTIYEKSLGALAKAGSTALVDVVPYAERVDKPGLVFMDTPGYDPPCTTGLIAGGANVLVFTTGRGSVLGLKPTPCIKVATNTPMYERMIDDMDLDAGPDPRRRAGRERGPPPLRLDPRGRQRRRRPRASGRGSARRSSRHGRSGRPSEPDRPGRGGPGPDRARPDIAPSLRILLPAIACLELLWLGWFLVRPAAQLPEPSVIRRGHLLLQDLPRGRAATRRSAQSMLGKGLIGAEPRREPPAAAADRPGRRADRRGGDRARRPDRPVCLGIRHRLRWPVRIALDYGLGAAILGVSTLIVGRMGWLDPWFIRIGLGSLAGLGLLGCRPRRSTRGGKPSRRRRIPGNPRDPPRTCVALRPADRAVRDDHDPRLDAARDRLRRPGVSPPGAQGVFPGRADRITCRTTSTRTCRSTWRCSTCSAWR